MPDLAELLNARKGLKSTEITTTLPSGEVRVEKKRADGTYQEISLEEDATESVSNRRRKKVEYLQRRGFIVDLEPDMVVGVAMKNVYFGSQDAAADLTVLLNYSITHIVNVGTGIQNHFPNKFEYLKIDILDLPETRILDYFEKVFDFIDKAKKDGKIFIHCNAGISRSATFAVGYLMRTQNVTYREAFDKCRETRSIRPNTGFDKQLKEYESLLAASRILES